MPESDQDHQPEPQPAVRPRLVISWAGPQSSDIKIEPPEGVTDGQLFEAAWLLDQYAREIRAAVLARQAQLGLQLVAGDNLRDLHGNPVRKS